MRIYGRSSREIDLYLQISSQFCLLRHILLASRGAIIYEEWLLFFADVCARQYAEYVIISNQTNVK